MSAETQRLAEELKRGYIRDRDLALEICKEWGPIDDELWLREWARENE